MDNSSRKELLKSMVGRYVFSNNVTVNIDADGVLMMKTYLTPGTGAYTTVREEKEGFILHTYYFVGTEVGTLNLIETINGINRELREGCMYVTDEGEVEYRNYLPDNGHTQEEDLARLIKLGIITFLENMDKIMSVINTVENLSDSDFVILDADDSEKVSG